MQRSFTVIIATALVATAAVAYFGAEQANRDAMDKPAGTGIPALEAQVARAPDNGDVWKSLAEAYRREGRQDDAIAAYVRASRIHPTDPEIVLALRDLAAAADK